MAVVNRSGRLQLKWNENVIPYYVFVILYFFVKLSDLNVNPNLFPNDFVNCYLDI